MINSYFSKSFHSCESTFSEVFIVCVWSSGLWNRGADENHMADRNRGLRLYLSASVCAVIYLDVLLASHSHWVTDDDDSVIHTTAITNQDGGAGTDSGGEEKLTNERWSVESLWRKRCWLWAKFRRDVFSRHHCFFCRLWNLILGCLRFIITFLSVL